MSEMTLKQLAKMNKKAAKWYEIGGPVAMAEYYEGLLRGINKRLKICNQKVDMLVKP